MNTNKKQGVMHKEESTELLNTPIVENNNKSENVDKNKKSNLGAAVAGAVGGFVAGAASGAAMSAAAMPANEVPAETEEVVAETTTDTPEAENVLLVNDEGVRVAHVEADSFSDAFAQARQQVGPGGVFEYRGQIYGTYYADEWNNMSAQERADYKQRVSGVAPTHHEPVSADASAHQSEVPSNAQMLDVEISEDNIRVLGVERVETAPGTMGTIATVELHGEVGMMIDIDNDDIVDVYQHDVNMDNRIDETESHNIHDAGIHISNLEHIHAAQEGNFLYASQDMLPDYVNDADMIMNA